MTSHSITNIREVVCDNTTLWKIGCNQTFYKGKCFDDHLLMEAGYLKQIDKTLEGDVAKVHSKQNWSGNLHNFHNIINNTGLIL